MLNQTFVPKFQRNSQVAFPNGICICLRDTQYTKPELLDTQPNQLWSGDITKVLGPTKWTYEYPGCLQPLLCRLLIAERESPVWPKN
jgi:hypothetical protein